MDIYIFISYYFYISFQISILFFYFGILIPTLRVYPPCAKWKLSGNEEMTSQHYDHEVLMPLNAVYERISCLQLWPEHHIQLMLNTWRKLGVLNCNSLWNISQAKSRIRSMSFLWKMLPELFFFANFVRFICNFKRGSIYIIFLVCFSQNGYNGLGCFSRRPFL